MSVDLQIKKGEADYHIRMTGSGLILCEYVAQRLTDHIQHEFFSEGVRPLLGKNETNNHIRICALRGYLFPACKILYSKGYKDDSVFIKKVFERLGCDE